MHLFGHREGRHTHPDGAIPVAVDRDLADALVAVEAAADDYLDAATPPTRAALVDALGRLDQLVDAGDEYANRVSARGLGFGPVSSGGIVGTGATGVLGSRGPAPFVEEVPSEVLRALVELVRCAKDDLAEGATGASGPLRSAAADLAATATPTGSSAGPATPEAAGTGLTRVIQAGFRSEGSRRFASRCTSSTDCISDSISG